MTTVLIVDDHAQFRSRAHALLEAEGYEVVGEAVDGATAVVEARRLRPDLVLLDVQLPGVDGFAVAALLGAQPEPPLVVLISSRLAEDYGTRLTSSTWSFIHKADISRTTLEALAGPPL